MAIRAVAASTRGMARQRLASEPSLSEELLFADRPNEGPAAIATGECFVVDVIFGCHGLRIHDDCLLQ
jgi:hypothetical protein